MNKINLSIVLATKNEEGNIGPCLESVKSIADEIIIFDEYSSDKTVEVAKRYDAKVIEYQHKTNFHETKQKAIDKASGDWILQLDADERVSVELAKEIMEVINSSNKDLLKRVLVRNSLRTSHNPQLKLFVRHQRLIEQREVSLGKTTGEVVAFFIPRINYFLCKPLIHAGVYPDGVIRLFKKGKARLPGKSVHELMEVDGDIGWLFNNLEHHESPTLRRYFDRANLYTTLKAQELKNSKVPKNFFYLLLYITYKPLYTFLNLYIRHKGVLDGTRGFVWSMLSAMHYPLSYYKYWLGSEK